MPLYVCDSRYNDRERVFVKIKNWNSCVPEEVRKSDGFMPIYPFERIVYPRRYASPFLQMPAPGSGGMLKGPGGIGEPIERAEGEKIEGGGTGRKRSKKAAASASATDTYGPSKGLYVGVPIPGQQGQSQQQALMPVPPTPLQTAQQQRPHTPQVLQPQASSTRTGDDRSIVTAAGGWGVLGTNASASKLTPEVGEAADHPFMSLRF
jgi:chromatin structure-remodeling complex subunit RSC1/2